VASGTLEHVSSSGEDDRREYMREYQAKWIAKRRADFLRDKSCEECGSREYLELHHIDPSRKTEHRIWSWSEKRRLAEIAKCAVLCRVCHHKKSMKDLKHGDITYYVERKCRCDLCRAANAKRERERRARKRLA
jgi:5-methylcytosine-specific restriction endonuclease McrA